ncbi:hypothetical protein [Streptomyces sp. NBC_00286]|uniref:hypothetical protein n=1 Tax=Streptomyces sp. NBC_00286 TaxID=2975701 RepID=UPI002E2C7D16|nr:hypothetical protein [Streptomyces sp. NBC_00286]
MAIQSLILEKKNNKWKAIVLPLGAALGIALDSAVREYGRNTPLALYTMATLSLTLTRVVFARYIGRQIGLPVPDSPYQYRRAVRSPSSPSISWSSSWPSPSPCKSGRSP